MSCLAIGVIILYFVFSLLRHKRRKDRELRELFAREIYSVEEERNRISRELHDGAAPLIGFSKAHVNEIKAGSKKDREHIENASGSLNKLAKQLREVAAGLTPSSLLRKGLQYSLQDFFHDVRQLNLTEIEFVYDVQTCPDPEKAIHLYRIVQEITNNTIKHAGARKLKVHFRERKQRLYLWCKDDGKGFDTESGDSGNGQGLKNLKSRTEILKGVIRYTSKPKHGTEYFFEFPIDNTKQKN
jgi:signal transduction histidine kinase